MALWERLFAVIPQILDDYLQPDAFHEYGRPRRRGTLNDDHDPPPPNMTLSDSSKPIAPIAHNIHIPNSNQSQAISMYHRALTLQQSNSEHMNQHIFTVPHPSSPNSYPSDFEDDDFDSYSMSSGDTGSFTESIASGDSRDSRESGDSGQSRDNTQSVLSEEEYIDFHRRLNFDELSSSLYDSHDELESEHIEDNFERIEVPDQPSWVELRRGRLEDNGPLIYRLTVCPERGKLDDDDWCTLEHLLTDLNTVDLSLCNVVLDEAAFHWLCRLNTAQKLRGLTVENGYFAHRSSKEEDIAAFGHLEGSDDRLAFEHFNEESFRFGAFCRSLLRNGHLESLRISHCNLGELVATGSAKEALISVLAEHRALRRVQLDGNGLSDGTLFVDALMVRTLPLEQLDLSRNPIPREDVQSIEWAATKHCASPFVNALGQGLGGGPSIQMEPALDLNESDDSDRDEREFMSSLFPLSESTYSTWFEPVSLENEEKNEGLSVIDRLECGIEIRAKRQKKRKMICNEFVFVSPEGDEVQNHQNEQLPPGTQMGGDGENGMRTRNRRSDHLMLRI